MKQLITLILISIVFSTYAQKASDVLERGIHIKNGESLFIRVEGDRLRYASSKSLQDVANPPNFITLHDSLVFLASKAEVNAYLLPVNPLNFTYNQESKIVINPIDKEAAEYLGNAITVIGDGMPQSVKSSKLEFAFAAEEVKIADCPKYQPIVDEIENLKVLLKDDKKADVKTVFESLKDLDFASEKSTVDGLAEIKKEMDKIEKHFEDVSAKILEIAEDVDDYDCNKSPKTFIGRYVFKTVLKDLRSVHSEQKKRFENLKKAYGLVEEAQKTASRGAGIIGLPWCIKLPALSAERGKLTIFTITLYKTGIELSDEGEIEWSDKSEITRKVLTVQRFRRFVPELAAGTAFTFFKYNTYGTTSDSTGQQFVAAPTENMVRNINLTGMLNFNYYIPNSPLHPFYQIGAGINAGIPTLLTGFGIRSNIAGIKRLAISGGVAFTWIKELDKLSVGDEISGTDDIDKDLQFQFATPRPYVGIQYNF